IRFVPIKELYENVRTTLNGRVKVLSFAPSERRVCFKKVTAMSRRVSETLSLTTVGGHNLTVTPNHIMYVKKKRLWKRLARDLKKRDEIAFLERLPYFKYSVDFPKYVRKGRGRRGHVIDL